MDAAPPPPIVQPAPSSAGPSFLGAAPAPPSYDSAGPAAANDEADGGPELGVGAFLLIGGAAGSYAGVSPFVVTELGDGVFLRPSAAIGESLATNLKSTWAAARLDTCVRLPGRYASRSSLVLELCGGPDVGFSYVAPGTLVGEPATAQTLPYVDLGPSVGLDAQAGRVGMSLRALAALDIARGGYDDVTGTRVDLPLFSWRLELAVSWEVLVKPTAGAAAQLSSRR